MQLAEAVKQRKRQASIQADEVIRPDDIAYVHSIFLQCFLPLRHTENNKKRWQVNNGNLSLLVKAGDLAKPNHPNEFAEMRGSGRDRAWR